MFSTVTETTLEEVSEMGESPISGAQVAELDSRVVLGNRQIAAVAFVILALLALVSAMAYLAGRVMTTATQVPVVQKGPEQVIVVDSKPAVPVVAPVAAPVAPAAPQVAPVAVAPAAVSDSSPARGESYFQVGSVDRGMADVSVEYIKKNGLEARVAPGISANVFRVLVGPVGESDAAATESRLKALGFTPFVKRY